MKHRTALVSLLAVGLLVWFLRHANLADVWRQVQRARMDLLAGRAWASWRPPTGRAPSAGDYLLSPIGPTRFRTVFRATIIGFAALGLLPARAGDVLRPYLVARQEGLSLSSTFATIVIERVLDLIAVLLAAGGVPGGGGRRVAHVAGAAAVGRGLGVDRPGCWRR